MYIQSFQNAAASKITVTGTATNIFDLINTAGSTTLENAGFSSRSNAIIIQPEDGDVRVLFNNQVPTATNGFKISSGSIATFCNVPLKSLKLIRTSANVICSVQIGISDMSESSSVTGSGGGSSAITSIIPGTGATNLGKAEDTAHTTGDTGVAMLAKRTDTAANSAGTDGDYSTINNDSLGHLWNREGYAPLYENNSLQRAMTLQGVPYTNISASALIKTGSGYFAGFIVNSASAGATIKFWDNTSAATTVLLNTITYTAAASQGGDNKVLASPAAFGTGLYATITGTMDVTIFWL